MNNQQTAFSTNGLRNEQETTNFLDEVLWNNSNIHLLDVRLVFNNIKYTRKLISYK
jgi:hypothetical protein